MNGHAEYYNGVHERIKIFHGSASQDICKQICKHLGAQAGRVELGKFSDGETKVVLQESVRGCDCFVVQSPYEDVNDHFMELLIMIHALKGAFARRITAVIPQYPYARGDKKDGNRRPITAKLVANLLQVAGVDSIITMDVHADQIGGFFSIPVDLLFANPLIEKWIRNEMAEDYILVSPDAGGVKRVTSLAKQLKVDVAIIHKERKVDNEVDKMILIGNVENRTAIIIDDMADTCGTMCLAADTLHEFGATKVIGLVTHGILSGPALERIKKSKLQNMIVTNTLPQIDNIKKCNKIEQIDVSSLFADAIQTVHQSDHF